MLDTVANALVARYTAKGGNADRGRELLADLVSRHSGENLATALVHWGFATEAAARRLVYAGHF